MRSILADEGRKFGEFVEPLPAALDQRRRALASANEHTKWVSLEQYSVGAYANFRPESVSDLTDYEPETEYTIGGYISPYEDIGRELVPLVEDYQFAPDKNERARAEKELDEFFKRVGARLAPGRPSEGLPRELLNKIVAQGRSLVELCWNISSFEISGSASDIFYTHSVPDSERHLWAARLALPVFSCAELQALQAESREAAAWTRGTGQHPTARRFIIWVLAHRLRADATTIARAALNTEDAEYFRDRSNPIHRFLP